jgi:hypothetical protein
MDIGRIISNIATFLKENWVVIIGVGVATFLVGSVKMFLVNIAYRGIAREIEEHRKTSLRMSPVSIEKLKEIVGSQHQMLSWMLSGRYILAECFERLKDEGLIVWSDELKAYCFSK